MFIHTYIRISPVRSRISLIYDMSKLDRIERISSWSRALSAARRTVGKEATGKEPSESWIAKMCLAEHSPIRLIEYEWTWKYIPQWVTAHMVRHHIGCEKFVHTQRTDRRADVAIPRDELPQGALNEMDMSANVQSIINISRKRLCRCASKETREAWEQVVNGIRGIDRVVADKCVPECVYRGFCPEFMSTCKYSLSNAYKAQKVRYLRTDYDDSWTLVDDYEVSRFGDIKRGGYLLRTRTIGTGLVAISGDVVRSVDDLVVKAFGDPKAVCTNHIDGNIYNNQITNLEWKKI